MIDLKVNKLKQVIDRLHAEAIVVSDIHISEPGDEKSKLLYDLIDRINKGKVEYFILLGDIFDFCLGSHSYYQRKLADFGQKLTQCANNGTKIVYLEGNHEFRLADFRWPGVNFVQSEATEIHTSGGRKLRLGHGDLIYSHNRYRKFRRVVKSHWFTELASYLPGWVMDLIARKASESSRAHDSYRTIHHDRILEAAYNWLENSACEFGLFGHFHVPYAESRKDDKPGALLSVECWDQPNALMLSEGIWHRIYPELTTNSHSPEGWYSKITNSYFADKNETSRPSFVPR